MMFMNEFYPHIFKPLVIGSTKKPRYGAQVQSVKAEMRHGANHRKVTRDC